MSSMSNALHALRMQMRPTGTPAGSATESAQPVTSAPLALRVRSNTMDDDEDASWVVNPWNQEAEAQVRDGTWAGIPFMQQYASGSNDTTASSAGSAKSAASWSQSPRPQMSSMARNYIETGDTTGPPLQRSDPELGARSSNTVRDRRGREGRGGGSQDSPEDGSSCNIEQHPEELEKEIRKAITDIMIDSVGDLAREFWSQGCARHLEQRCKPCHYILSPQGCLYGHDCQFCHLPHRKVRCRTSKTKKKHLKADMESLESEAEQDQHHDLPRATVEDPRKNIVAL